jgi:hypothetical protein
METRRLDGTCSATYFYRVSEFDDIRKTVELTILKESRLPGGPRISAIYSFILRENKVLMNNFKNAGFKEVDTYPSNNHGNRIVSLMRRRVTSEETRSGVVRWKIHKARKLRSSARR